MHKTQLTIGCRLRISRFPWQAVSACLQGCYHYLYYQYHALTRKRGSLERWCLNRELGGCLVQH